MVQLIRRAWSATPAVAASWSMIPHGTPLARCSAAWQICAIWSGVPEAPRASATATSNAALDARPAPMGSSVVTVPPARPTVGRTSATTPAT